MSKVSIVIPCHDVGSLLSEAVQSALGQTWPDSEVLIVDDGSTDQETLRLLRNSTWPRTRIIHQANAGPAAARNRAIREATGDYILPLDADDLLEPTYAAKAAAVLDAQPNVGIVYCRAIKFGNEHGPWELKPYSADELAIGNVIFVSAMFRKTHWAAVGGFDERLRDGMEDYDFWLKLVHAGCEVVRLEEALFRYRVRTDSRTSDFERGRDSVVATYAKVLRNNRDFFVEHAESLFRHRFGLYQELAALRDRLERESADAKHELDVLKTSKAEADRYNASLQAELGRVRMLYSNMQRRFRWLRLMWPRENKTHGTPE